MAVAVAAAAVAAAGLAVGLEVALVARLWINDGSAVSAQSSKARTHTWP